MSGRCSACFTSRSAVIPMWGTVTWCRECALEKGGLTGRRAVMQHDIGTTADAYTPDILRRIANGAIMDANVLFLPAGKLSPAETAERERAGMERLA